MNLLEKTEQLFHSARVSFIEAASALYDCREQEVWKEQYESWADFLEVLGLSQSAGSKMLSSYEHFVIEGGVSHAKLATVELEKAYLAIELTGTAHEQIEKASLLSRAELKEQKVFEKTGQEHVHSYVCRICHHPL